MQQGRELSDPPLWAVLRTDTPELPCTAVDGCQTELGAQELIFARHSFVLYRQAGLAEQDSCELEEVVPMLAQSR